MTDQQEATEVSRSTQTEETDITADPDVPDWSDIPGMGPNGNGEGLPDLRVADLEGWLQRESLDTIMDALAKAREYGGGNGDGDLDIMAGAMRILVPNLQNHQQALAAVLAFYQLGKVSRSLAALANGRMPSQDTPKDTHVYALMQMKVQETGRWV